MARNASQRHISSVATISAVGATLVMTLAMATSYGTQRELLSAHGLGWASSVIPATVDVLAIMSNLALTLPRRVGFSRKGLWFILVLTLSVSSVANWMSGHTTIASTAHVWVVVAYFLAEYIVNWVRSYRAAWATEVEEIETAKQMAATEAPAEDLPELTAAGAADPALGVAPVSPAVGPVAGNKRGAYGPRDPERGYAPSTVRAQKAAARKSAESAE